MLAGLSLVLYLQPLQARKKYLNSDTSTLKMLCKSCAAGHLDLQIWNFPQHNIEKPAGLEGYVDTSHYELICANNPELAATLV